MGRGRSGAGAGAGDEEIPFALWVSRVGHGDDAGGGGIERETVLWAMGWDLGTHGCCGRDGIYNVIVAICAPYGQNSMAFTMPDKALQEATRWH